MATLRSNPAELKNPGEKYLAATRLGACTSAASLERLIEAGGNSSDNLYERITRRKALEALGRRKSPQALPVLIQALHSEDEPAVVNAADAIARIGAPLEQSGITALIQALAGPDNQRRAVIQAFTRLNLSDQAGAIAQCRKNSNPLVAGAAHAHAVKVCGDQGGLDPLMQQLRDENPTLFPYNDALPIDRKSVV